MTAYQNHRWLLLPALLITLVGCGADDDVEYIYPQLELKFAPSIPQQTFNVNRIVIAIEGPNLDAIIQEFEVEPGQRRLNVHLIVPLDATSIRVEAYEIDDQGQERIAFKGESPISDLDKAEPQITVQLDLATAHLTLRASKTDLAIDETFTMEISVAEVENLFAIAFEVIYDNQKLEPTSISAGPIFGTDPIWFNDLDLSRPANRVGIAVAQGGGLGGVSTSGVAAIISFRAKETGNAIIRIARQTESEVFALQKKNGNPIPDFERLAEYLTRATVTVNIK